MKKINWGIIGCGDVTEIKSGPAFNKISNSALVAVMRRDGEKAKDYAHRHSIPRWYDDANRLINDPGVNAVYIATPPSSHEEHALAAIDAAKPVYLEKPMALNYSSALKIANASTGKNIKLVVAHYRREQPLFKKIKQLINDNAIGVIRFVHLEYYRPLFTGKELADPKNAWRVNPAISGGGLFHDLAPHQLDMMYHLFGPVKKITGVSTNQAHSYPADDIVTGNMLFNNGIVFSGSWCFTATPGAAKDHCEIIGKTGTISFSFFSGNIITVNTKDETGTLSFDILPHVQQPMIEKTVQYFLDEGQNPCSGQEGAEVLRLMEGFLIQ